MFSTIVTVVLGNTLYACVLRRCSAVMGQTQSSVTCHGYILTVKPFITARYCIQWCLRATQARSLLTSKSPVQPSTVVKQDGNTCVEHQSMFLT